MQRRLGMPRTKAAFLSDICSTGYMAAENAEIEPGDIDRVPERLEMARTKGRAETIKFDEQGRV